MKEKHRKTLRRILFVTLLIVFASAAVIAVYNLITTQLDYSTAQNEYDSLRQFAPEMLVMPSTADQAGDGDVDLTEPESETGQEFVPGPGLEPDGGIMFDLQYMNPDFIGWLRIEGTGIDYPVVQCSDKQRYLNTTFLGAKNPSGTIFMDMRSADGFDGFTILHGHNMRDGSMFAELHSYTNSIFRAEHDEILIFTPDGQILIYNVFDVRETDVFDTIYTLIGASAERVYDHFTAWGLESNTSILVLSTCIRGDNDARLLVLASR